MARAILRSGSCRVQGSDLTSSRQPRNAGLLLTASPTSLTFPVYSTESKQFSAFTRPTPASAGSER